MVTEMDDVRVPKIVAAMRRHGRFRPSRRVGENRRTRFPFDQIFRMIRRHAAPGVKNQEFISAFNNGGRVMNTNATVAKKHLLGGGGANQAKGCLWPQPTESAQNIFVPA